VRKMKFTDLLENRNRSSTEQIYDHQRHDPASVEFSTISQKVQVTGCSTVM